MARSMPNMPGIAVVAPENRPEEREPNLQSQVGRPRRLATAPSRQKPRFAEASKQVGSHLAQPSPEDWKNQKPEVIAQYYAQTESDFFGIVNDYLSQANSATNFYRRSSLSHRRWRFWIIIATGMLAAINVCAALELLKTPHWGET
jgi:hypothetical protein